MSVMRSLVIGGAVVLLAACTSTGGGEGADGLVGAPASATTDPTDFELRRLARPPHDVTFCTSIGEVSLVLPGPIATEGPRPLRHIAEPARGTFAYSQVDRLPVRYDAYVIEGADAYGEGEDLLRGVIDDLNGTGVLEYERIDGGSFVEATYVDEVRDQRHHAWAAAHDGIVISVSVSRWLAIPGPDRSALEAELAEITASIDVSGLGASAASCGESSVRAEVVG